MSNSEIKHFTKLKKGQVSPVVVVVGDPARAEKIANMADSSKLLAFNKDFKSYDCVIKGVHFTAMSHGIGNTGAALCFQELIECGAKCIIRAGTSGYLRPGMHQGDIFITYGAIREEGVTPRIVGDAFPAIPTPEVFQYLVKSAKKLGYTYHTGISLTSDIFYTPADLKVQMKKYSDMGVASVSMEESSLFILGTMYNIWTGVVQVFDGSPFSWEDNDYNPHGDGVQNAKERMINVCLDTIPLINSHFE